MAESENLNPEISDERIVNEVREDIKKRGLCLEIPSFSSIPVPDGNNDIDGNGLRELKGSLDYIKTHWNIPYYPESKCSLLTALRRKLTGVLVKAVVLPMSQRQTQFNVATMRNLNYLYERSDADHLTVSDSNNRILELENQIRAYEKELTDLKEKIDRLYYMMDTPD